uniref:RNA-directed RNA polymerase n=1 Tax=Beihai levi-like virus 23 TaxID=1922409 RepID=A0A1L3KI18_9VIRU|nr:hypothetical protein [Beihai levi-like virus 23]
MQKTRHKRKSSCQNFLPAHICNSFQQELETLVSTLVTEAGKEGSVHAQFKAAYLAAELKSKYCDSTTTPAEERRAAAITKWLATEDRNRVTNQRLLIEGADFGWTTSDRLDGLVRDIIRDILGPFDYWQLITAGGHTNGATTRVKRSPYGAILKHAGTAHASESLLPHWAARSVGTVLEHQKVVVRNSSELFTVPKATDIDRVACKEPELNMFQQRSIGKHIRRRLRAVAGINLNDQTVNQRLARDALHLGLATIDLSAASDSITEQLVVNWLPPEWFLLLNDLRVKSVRIPNWPRKGQETTRELSMFSSMGNGFTFELESLLFYALTRAVAYLTGAKGKISVYGDDIICPASIGPRLARVFAWYGFKVNPKKSNWSGYFRESCGKHYHRGLDVTPFYLRGPVKSKTDVIRLLNRLLVWDGSPIGFITDDRVLEFHQKWSLQIPRQLWGGQDPEDITSLVTGHSPRMRLTRSTVEFTEFREDNKRHIKVPRPLGQKGHRLLVGAYDGDAAVKYWLTHRGEGDDPLFVDPGKEGKYQISPQPAWLERSAWTPWLLTELESCTEVHV